MSTPFSSTYRMPAPAVPLCQGDRDTVLTFRSISSHFYNVEASLDDGATWQNFGLLAPMTTLQFWRSSGELWRVRGNGGSVVTSLVTEGGRPTVVVS